MENNADLGRLIGEFGWNKGRAKTLLWVWGFLLLPSSVLSLAFIGIPCLIFSLCIIWRSLSRLRATRPAIRVYEQGIEDARTGRVTVLRHEEIAAFYISAKMIVGVLNYVIKLETANKRRLTFDEHLANVEHLKDLLEAQFVRHHLQGAISACRSGKPVAFGDLQVTEAGLAAGKRTLPWQEFASAEFQMRSYSRRHSYVCLRILQRDGGKDWYTQDRDTFPNIALFLALIDAIRQPPQNV